MIIFYYIVLALAIIFGLVYTVVIHRLLLKWTPYRWVVNSIIWPYTYFSIKHKLKGIDNISKTYYLTQDYWYSKFWFGKRVTKIIENSFK